MPVIIIAVIVVVSVAGGVRFRQGKSRQWLANYRNPGLPAIYRNLPMVGPFMAIAGVPIMVIAAPAFLGFEIHLDISHRVAGIGLFGAVAFVTGLTGAAAVWSVRPPGWLIPRWLRDEDRQLGFVPPRMDWFDWATLLFGAGVLLLGAGLAVEVVILLFSPS